METPTASEALDILGLTPSERRIIQTTSKMALNVSNIAASTKVPRTSLLYILNKLEKRKLIRRMRVGKRFFWKSDIYKSMRKLSNIPASSFKSGPNYSSTNSGIVTYHGVNSILNIFEQMANLPKNSRVYGLEPDNSIKYAIRKNKLSDLLKVNENIKKNALIIEGIVHEKSVSTVINELGVTKSRKLFQSFIGRLEDYVKIPDEFADVEAEVWIFNGSAYIINWNKEIAIEITDKDMTSIILAMFSCVKELGTRYSQNKKMEIYSPK
jgi:DNA-binding Lrp family transcriptional regulator